MRVATIPDHFWNRFFTLLSILHSLVISVQSECPQYGMRNAEGDATSNWEFFQVQDSNISISCLLCARWTSSVLSTFELITPCRDGDMSLVEVKFSSFSFVHNTVHNAIAVQWIKIDGSDCKSVYNSSSDIDTHYSSYSMMDTFVKRKDEPFTISIPVENINEAHLLRVQGTYSENSIVCLTDVSLRYTSNGNPSTENVAVINETFLSTKGSTTTEDFDMSSTGKSATTPGVETSDEGKTFHSSDVTPSGKVSDSSKQGTMGYTQYSTTTSIVGITSLAAQANIGLLIVVVIIVVCLIALFLAGAVFIKRFHVKRRVKQSDNIETRSLDPESDVNRKQISPADTDIGQMEIHNEAFETTLQDEVIFTHPYQNKSSLVGEHDAIAASSEYAEVNKRSQKSNRDHPAKRGFQAPSTRDNEGHIKKGNNVDSDLHTNTQEAMIKPAKTKTNGGVVSTSKLTSVTDGGITFDKDEDRSKMRGEKEDIHKTKNYIVVTKNEDGNLSENSKTDKHHPVADEKILGQGGESFEKDLGFYVEDEYSEVSDKLERRTSAPKYGEIAKDDASPQVKYKFHVADKPNLPEVPYGTVDKATKIDNVHDSKAANGLSEVYMKVSTSDESPPLNSVKSESSQNPSLQENVGRLDEEGTATIPEDELVDKEAEIGQMGASMGSHQLLLDSEDQYCEIPEAVNKASDTHATVDVSPAQGAGDKDSGMDPTNKTANLTRLRKDRRPSIYVEYDNRNHNLADTEDEYSEVADARKRVTQVYAEVGTDEAGAAINNRDDDESGKNKNGSFPISTPIYRDVGKRKMDSAKANNHELVDEYGAVADALKRVTPIYAEVDTDERGIPSQNGRDEASGIKRTILPSMSTPIYGGVVKPNSRNVTENGHLLATDNDYGEVADAVKRITPVYAEVKDDMSSPVTGHDGVHEMQRNKSPAINVPIYAHTSSSKGKNSAAPSSEAQYGEVSDV